MKKTKAEKGITLVALIITIIVLLILAVVAINAVQNDGIIEYAKNARTEYEKAQGNEQSILNYYTSEIQAINGIHNGTILGTYTKAGEETALKKGEKFPETVTTGDKYVYGDYEYCYNSWYKYTTSEWREDETIDGWGVKLIVEDENQNGEDDERAKIESVGEILTTINNSNVRSLQGTFAYCTKLSISPKIPKTVYIMMNTFYECTSLSNSPEIPDEVISLSATFYNCEALTKAPSIPEGVTNMHSTFSGCSSLKAAPVIPSSVTKINATFQNCYNLEGDIIINCENLESWSSCLNKAGYKLDDNGQVIQDSKKTITLIGANETILKNLQATSVAGNVNYEVIT